MRLLNSTSNEPTVRLTRITPVQALKMLDRNTANRPMREAHVRFLSQQMQKGHWRLTGDTIKFDRDGNLIDGQHRLRAVALGGVHIDVYVAENVDPSSKNVIDTGAKRTPADVLTFFGLSQTLAKVVGPAIVWCFRYEKEIGELAPSTKISNDDITEFFDNNSNIADMAELVMSWPKNRRVIPITMATFILFQTSQIDEELALDFVEKLCTGNRLDPDETVNYAREHLEGDLRGVTRVQDKAKLGLIINAWNRTRSGKPVARRNRGNLRWYPSRGSFPKFK